PMGLEGKAKAQMSVAGKPKKYLIEELNKLSRQPDEIWISCSFTFDYEIVYSIIKTCKLIYPSSIIRVGGDFIRLAPELARKLNVDYCDGRIEEADLCLPDFSVRGEWEYGLFQLQSGCLNRCSFCTIGLDKPMKFPVSTVIKYMKKFYEKFKPQIFWNWDPNILIYPKHFENFLTEYLKSGIKAKLNLVKGIQPSFIDESIVGKMVKAGFSSVTIPMEAADPQTIKKYNKPYTVISSIKTLSLARKYGLDLKECPSTFIIGHPDDNFASIFRIYITILKFGGNPVPFPVFLFPKSIDYKRYFYLIKHKDLSELHGQLWPLIRNKDIAKYQNLFEFLIIPNLEKAKANLHLLTPALKELFLGELEKNDKFIDLCLKARKDTIKELRRIGMEMKKTGKKKEERLLCIIANPKPSKKSISRHLGDYFLKNYIKKYPHVKITTLDLYKEKIEFINHEYVEALFNKEMKVSSKTQQLIDLADKYIKAIEDASQILIISPMWTMSIPAILKAFFEMVASRNFYYFNRKFSSKPAVCILTRDGAYPRFGENFENSSMYINVQE
ncbi:MAG: radical SAM protein, partial [Candidatus Omnitrophica bacterium]|nr:radical SAM protein [Candidatus Omnitrophota bacterium]